MNSTHFENNVLSTKPTKGSILKLIAKVYDPLWYLDPFMIKARVLFQRIWPLRLSWDEHLPDECAKQWYKWYKQMQMLHLISIERFLHLKFKQQFFIHVFGDASKDAYFAVAHVRTIDDHEVHVNLVISKTRPTPLNSKSIPHLQLMAATIAARLAQTLTQALKGVTFWTHSMMCCTG